MIDEIELYKLEDVYRSKQNISIDDVLRYAIIETIPPIADYSSAIRILNEHMNFNDVRIVIMASYLSSTWENYKENPYINILQDYCNHVDDRSRSIIYYLSAYEIYMRKQVNHRKKEYIDLLKKSIYYCHEYVYPYFRLAKVSDSAVSKEYLDKGRQNVIRILKAGEVDSMKISELVDYDFFVKEHIEGTIMTESNFANAGF